MSLINEVLDTTKANNEAFNTVSKLIDYLDRNIDPVSGEFRGDSSFITQASPEMFKAIVASFTDINLVLKHIKALESKFFYSQGTSGSNYKAVQRILASFQKELDEFNRTSKIIMSSKP